MRTALALLLILVVPAVAVAAPPPGPGAETYATHCARCHGEEGQPDLPGTPDFSQGQGLTRSDADLMEAIRFGIGTMPGFEGAIDNEELIDVLFYIRTLEH